MIQTLLDQFNSLVQIVASGFNGITSNPMEGARRRTVDFQRFGVGFGWNANKENNDWYFWIWPIMFLMKILLRLQQELMIQITFY